MKEFRTLHDQELENVAGGQTPEEAALESVLRHIKAAKGDVNLLNKIAAHDKQGRKVYKIKLSCRGVDFDFDVDAMSGEILKV